MFVGKVLEVLRDQEEMKNAFVNQFEVRNRPAGFWVEDREAEADLLTGLGSTRSGSEPDRVFDRIGKAGNQFHAATRTAAGFELPNIGIHGAEEFDRLFDSLLGTNRQ